ncbi:VOC family protein [Sphingomonas oligophenolica]|uniref:VOC family protein n=1 Tax=Sphingomonas oligophenolica TaxID=301154 RepID=A0A502CKD5_9SPHN|nr:VOC family protein [Sphingomonas oligophenolica]TPG12161.1 VOC family protein [Sphingomonas oligophenolica]
MANPHGTPIWYELMTADPDASKAFYDLVIGWSVEAQPAGDMDYRMIATVGGDQVGGVMRLTDDMAANGAKSTWLFYIGVDDVDASATKIQAAGGALIVPPTDIPDVGRFAFATDPQGIPFYIMRGSSPDASGAYDRNGMGKCNWNELITPDQRAANAFYAEVFGWTYPDKMEMPGDMGDYIFIDIAGQQIGATMQYPGEGPDPGWRFYFRTPDIDASAQKVADVGGTVMMGPHDVPGGGRIIVATDPHGVVFGAVGAGAA